MSDIEELRNIDMSSKEGQWEMTAKENFRLLMECRDEKERLRVERDRYRSCLQEMDIDPDWLVKTAKRIEELEERREKYWETIDEMHHRVIDAAISGELQCPDHHIPRDKIRKMVEYATDEEKALPDGCQGMCWDVLNMADIVRCEGCGGRARGWIDNDPNAEGSYEAVCPDCNGEGFKIGGGDG